MKFTSPRVGGGVMVWKLSSPFWNDQSIMPHPSHLGWMVPCIDYMSMKGWKQNISKHHLKPQTGWSSKPLDSIQQGTFIANPAFSIHFITARLHNGSKQMGHSAPPRRAAKTQGSAKKSWEHVVSPVDAGHGELKPPFRCWVVWLWYAYLVKCWTCFLNHLPRFVHPSLWKNTSFPARF